MRVAVGVRVKVAVGVSVGVRDGVGVRLGVNVSVKVAVGRGKHSPVAPRVTLSNCEVAYLTNTLALPAALKDTFSPAARFNGFVTLDPPGSVTV